MGERQKVGAGWEHQTRSGKNFVSIVINYAVAAGARLVMWPNGYKGENQKAPDHVLYLDDQKPGAGAGQSGQAAQDQPAGDDDVPPGHTSPHSGDEIPF